MVRGGILYRQYFHTYCCKTHNGKKTIQKTVVPFLVDKSVKCWNISSVKWGKIGANVRTTTSKIWYCTNWLERRSNDVFSEQYNLKKKLTFIFDTKIKSDLSLWYPIKWCNHKYWAFGIYHHIQQISVILCLSVLWALWQIITLLIKN